MWTTLRASRGVSPVIGVVLFVAVVVLLAATAGVLLTSLADQDQSAPQYTAVSVDAVETSANGTEIAADDPGMCKHYHLLIRLSHAGGDSFDASDLEYVVEVSGEDGTTLFGRFNETVAEDGTTARTGEEILIALDSDTDVAGCGTTAADSKSTVLFGGKQAWDPEAAGQVGDLYDVHDTFLESNTPELAAVSVRIVHRPSDTVTVDETEDRIEDLDS